MGLGPATAWATEEITQEATVSSRFGHNPRRDKQMCMCAVDVVCVCACVCVCVCVCVWCV